MPESNAHPQLSTRLFFGLIYFLFSLSGTGAAIMVLGNTILGNLAHLSGYTTNAHAAAIGATGGFAALSVMMYAGTLYIKYTTNHWTNISSYEWCFNTLFVSAIGSALTGLLGCAILRDHVDLGIDLAHSAASGTIGGLIMSPLIGSLLFLILTIQDDSLWRVMQPPLAPRDEEVNAELVNM